MTYEMIAHPDHFDIKMIFLFALVIGIVAFFLL